MKNNYKDLSINELNAEESKLRSELFNLTFQNKVGQLADTSRIRIVKKNIARVKTALNEKKMAGAKDLRSAVFLLARVATGECRVMPVVNYG